MTGQEIIEQVCLEHLVRVSDVIGKSRKRVLCEARRDISRRLQENRFTVKQICRLMKRDRTTINYQLLPKLRAAKKEWLRKNRGRNVMIRNQHVAALEQYAALTGATLGSVVNQAVSDLLDAERSVFAEAAE